MKKLVLVLFALAMLAVVPSAFAEGDGGGLTKGQCTATEPCEGDGGG